MDLGFTFLQILQIFIITYALFVFTSELLLAAVPFNVMKMSVPLSILLSLTPIYVRPALPLPTRSVSIISFL